MLHTAKTQPATFFAVGARLIPSDVKLTVEQTYAGLGPDEYAILRAIKEALPTSKLARARAQLCAGYAQSSGPPIVGRTERLKLQKSKILQRFSKGM